MTTLVAKSSLFQINGVISTDKPVLENMTTIAEAGGAFITYDISEGKWAVIINEPTNSVASFTDNNIIGGITVNGSSINELYNAATIDFPHKDIRDQTDFIDLTLNPSERFAQELDNVLIISTDIVNDPIQAQYMAQVELKQNRLDKIITFTTDYSKIDLKAGDVISITNTIYGYTNKKFRIIQIEENDEDQLTINITALEYDESIYDTSGLTRTSRSKVNGILPQIVNEEIQESNDIKVGDQLSRLLLANAAASILGKLFKRIAGTDEFGPSEEGVELDKILRGFKAPTITTTAPTSICELQTATINIATACSATELCILDIPEFDYPWTITGVTLDDIFEIRVNNTVITPSLTGTISISETGSIAIVTSVSAGGTSSKTMTVKVGDVSKNIIIYDNLNLSYSTTASPATITEGQSTTVTVTTEGVANGTVIPYTITGTGTGRVSSPLSGNITINNNTASVTIATINDAVYTGTQSFTFTISPTLPANPCRGNIDLTAPVTLLDNDTAPPPPPPDFDCNPITIPLVWCGVADGTTGQIKSVYVQSSIKVCSPVPGQPTVTVPTAVSVTQGNPSTLTITATTQVSGILTTGGQEYQVITAFNPAGLNQVVMTGTTTKVIGFPA